MTPDQFTCAHLALFAWQRGQRNATNGILAMAFIVRNRARAGWYGGDWLEIIGNDYLTSPYREPELVVGAFPDTREPGFLRALQSIESVYDGTEPDPMTKGALYYAELNLVSSDWFKQNILGDPQKHWRIAQVGTLTLFL